MTDGIEQLLQWAGQLSGSISRVARLHSVLLGNCNDTVPGGPDASTLNNDGSSVQVCVTYGLAGRKVRIICDPAAGVEPLRLRLRLARRALVRTLAWTQSNALASSTETMLSYALPSSGELDELQAGFFWLAGGIDGGAAIYANMRWGNSSARWDDAMRWLDAVLPRSEPALSLLARLEPLASLASIGIEGSCLANARVKLYWRLRQPATFEDIGLHALQHPSATALLSNVIGETPIHVSGLVFSAAFRIGDGVLSDVKVDVCAHCLQRSADQWIEILDKCRVPKADLAAGLRRRMCDIALIGIGMTDGELPRVNVYMKVAAP